MREIITLSVQHCLTLALHGGELLEIRKVEEITHDGDTRLWDAIQLACTILGNARERLREAAEKRLGRRPNAEEQPVLRVLALTDGNDNVSVHTVQE